MIRLLGHRTLRRKLRIEPNEERPIRETLVALAAVRVDQPVDGVILIDGDYVGAAPTTIYLDEGEHGVEVVAPGFVPWRTTIDVPLGEEATLEPALELLPPEQACYRFHLTGSAKDAVKSLRKQLVGEQLQLAVPLYKVLTEIMENRVAVTHVLDGRRILFEPRTGDDYVDVPWKLARWRPRRLRLRRGRHGSPPLPGRESDDHRRRRPQGPDRADRPALRHRRGEQGLLRLHQEAA